MHERGTIAGAPAVTLANDAVRAVVVPALGGKIASLVHVPSGREWLWQNPVLPHRSPEYDGDFVRDFDTGGWDECFPAIRGDFFPAGPWRGTLIPDHGELWCLPWEVVSARDDALTLRVSGVRFPVVFTRTLRLRPTGLGISYEVENLASEPFPFLWCAHPLVAVRPGMELHIPSAIGAWRIYSGGPFLLDFDPPHVLPEPGAYAIKCFAPVYGGGDVALVDGDRQLRVGFSGKEMTHLGLWLNFGAWAGAPGAQPYYNIGVEPAIGPGDDLDLAMSHLGENGTIPAKGKQQWSLELTLT
jgi:hypothetical protein